MWHPAKKLARRLSASYKPQGLRANRAAAPQQCEPLATAATPPLRRAKPKNRSSQHGAHLLPHPRLHEVNAPHSSRRSPQLSAVPRTHDCPLNVVIPMGGLGRNEFTNAGYPTPKPMIPVVGRPMLFWLLDNLDLRDTDAVWLGSKRDVEAEYGIEAAVRREYPSLEVHFVRFDFDTRGATETLYCVLNAMDANQRRRRTISLDCDTLWFCDVLGGAQGLPSDTGASFYFHDDAEDASAPYSYIRVDPRTQKIVDIREKVAISRLANNGAYVFASAAQALAGLEELLDEKVGEVKKHKQHQAWVKDDDASSLNTALAQENPAAYSHRHHYVSGLIARLISNKAPFPGRYGPRTLLLYLHHHS